MFARDAAFCPSTSIAFPIEVSRGGGDGDGAFDCWRRRAWKASRGSTNLEELVLWSPAVKLYTALTKATITSSRSYTSLLPWR